MQFRIFNIPIDSSDSLAMEEMNAFLRAHRILEIDRQFVKMEHGGLWTFCISYVERAKAGIDNKATKPKIDYREILPPQQFAVFAELRKIRKNMAEAEGIPAFAIFTNEELAAIAQLDELKPDALLSINGIGQKKAEKYGAKLIETFEKHNAHETTRPSA